MMISMLYRVLIFSISCILFFPADLAADDVRRAVREGNQRYGEGKYGEAEIAYRKALESDQNNFKAWFNLGNALYQQGRHKEAADIFDQLSISAENDAHKAASFHNKGNALLKEQQFPESVEAYKNALRHMPGDEASRYNLAYAMQFLQDPPPEEEPSEGEDDQESKNENENEQAANDQQDREEQDEQRISTEHLSAQEAERLLDAMNQLEQKIQEQVKREETIRQELHVEKEW